VDKQYFLTLAPTVRGLWHGQDETKVEGLESPANDRAA